MIEVTQKWFVHSTTFESHQAFEEESRFASDQG